MTVTFLNINRPIRTKQGTMNSRITFITTAISAILLLSWRSLPNIWIQENYKDYTIYYNASDKENMQEYNHLINNGIAAVGQFFNDKYVAKFNIYIHPDRNSLDSTWQKDWNMPDFKSDCWMVASGTATQFDLISPKNWITEACEHNYLETEKTQKLITHELFHVYHGQLNVSPDFSKTEGIDWFIEGLATYASGQCDSIRISDVKTAIENNNIPQNLDEFWTGRLRYGLSGTVVMFIDYKYGRTKLKEILFLQNKTNIMLTLNTTETELLREWKNYVLNLQ